MTREKMIEIKGRILEMQKRQQCGEGFSSESMIDVMGLLMEAIIGIESDVEHNDLLVAEILERLPEEDEED